MKYFFIIICFLQLNTLSAQTKEESFDQQIARLADSLKCSIPDEENPVMLNAQLVSSNKGDSIAVIVKVSMASGWHLYAYVPPNLPYITTELLLESNADLNVAGEWKKSSPIASTTDIGVLIYEDVAIFTRKLAKGSKTPGKITTGLYYQTCNLQQCLPPTERKLELAY